MLLSDLAQRFDCSERQIRRDLDALMDAGVPVHRGIKAGRASAALPSSNAVFELSIRERYALLVARKLFDVFEGTPFQEDIDGIFDKVRGSLPESQQHELDAHADRLVYLPSGGTKSYHRKADTLDAVVTGVLRRCAIAYSYKPNTGRIARGILRPYALVLYRNGLYVLGARATRSSVEAVRVLAVDRFSSARTLRTNKFEVPADFSPSDFFQGAFGIFGGGEVEHVVLEFSRAVSALVVAREWHPSQRLRILRSGAVELTMDVTHQAELYPWILGWAGHVVVKKPATLREGIQKELQAAMARYR